MKCGSKFGPVPKNRGAVGRASWLPSFLGVPDAKFFVKNPRSAQKEKESNEGLPPGRTFNLPEAGERLPGHTKKSLNSVRTCLRGVDTRRFSTASSF